MKTQQQIDAAENYRCVEILHKEHDFPFEGFEIVRAMREFGKEMWNMAIEEAAENARLELAFNFGSFDEKSAIFKETDRSLVVKYDSGHGECGYEANRISKQSILKLKR